MAAEYVCVKTFIYIIKLSYGIGLFSFERIKLNIILWLFQLGLVVTLIWIQLTHIDTMMKF